MYTAEKFLFMHSQKRNCAASESSPNVNIHVSVFPTIGPPIFLQQNMLSADRSWEYIIAHRNMNVGIVVVAA
jgi:hypothetical protein